MCGIVSYSGKKEFNIDKIKLLLTYNSLERGEDSLGFYSPLNGLYKKAGKPVDLMPKMPLVKDNYFIGHVRAGTVGAKTDKNAHPFQFQELIGVMNGTIYNHTALAVKYGINPSAYDVDSEILFAIIQKEQSFNVLGEMNGGGAVVVGDTKNPNIMYVYKNVGRTLFRGKLDDGMYISSIKESLEIIGCEDVKEFKDNNVYTIIDGVVTNNHPIKIDVYNDKLYTDISGRSKISINDINNSNYINRWMLFDSPSYGGRNLDEAALVKNFEVDKWYYCYNYHRGNELQVFVRDDKNKSILLEKRAFTYLASFPMTGDPMMLLTNLYYPGNKKKAKLLAAKGTIVKLSYYDSKNKVEFSTTEDPDVYWTTDSKCIRPLNWQEKWKVDNNATYTAAAANNALALVHNRNLNNFELTEHEDVNQLGYPKKDYRMSNDIHTAHNSKHDSLFEPPWTSQFTLRNSNQLELISDVNIDDEDVPITHREFKTILQDLQLSLNSIIIEIYSSGGTTFINSSDIEPFIVECNLIIETANKKYLRPINELHD